MTFFFLTHQVATATKSINEVVSFTFEAGEKPSHQRSITWITATSQKSN